MAMMFYEYNYTPNYNGAADKLIKGKIIKLRNVILGANQRRKPT